MKVLLIGSSGQLGNDLKKVLELRQDEILVPSSSDIDVSSLDITKIEGLEFDCLINCSSYHRVDELEDNQEKAFKINSYAVGKMAKICEEKKAEFITFSTDYVFGNTDLQERITEEDKVSPLNIYGLSKSFGENLAFYYHSNPKILRVASLFGTAGSSGKGGNFVESITKASKERAYIEVVDDQIMSPTSTVFVSDCLDTMLNEGIDGGIFNVVCDGAVSWYQFAKDIIELLGQDCEVRPIKSITLKQKALRPNYSALSIDKISNLGLNPPSYKKELERYLINKGYT